MLGILSILIVWILWIFYVDLQVGHPGAYWQVRKIGTVPLTAGPFTFLQRTARVLVFSSHIGEILKYVSVLAVILVDMWVLLIVRLRKETHRLAILFSIFSMLGITFVLNNPNKIIVYTTTFPGHLSIGLIFLQQAFGYHPLDTIYEKLVRIASGVMYLAFCFLMALFYMIGTPLEWYY
jgi:hypothetical protein